MADETYADLGLYSILKNEGLLDMKRVVTRRTNGADIKPGHLVTSEGETDPDVDQMDGANDATFLGIAWKHAYESDIPDNWDIDDAFADNTEILIILPHGGQLGVYLHLAPKGTSANEVSEGDMVVCSAESGGDGQIDKGATDGSHNPNLVVGVVAPEEAADPGATDADIIEVYY